MSLRGMCPTAWPTNDAGQRRVKRSSSRKTVRGGAEPTPSKTGVVPAAESTAGGFAHSLIRWQRQHGRLDLPWQNTRDPYRIWLSEVMLQQTQVATVIPYYQRFLARFPDVHSLAEADRDEVLALWSGLGYYSRARNLHKAAIEVAAMGGFPKTRESLETLSGVGRSTAAAIAVFSEGCREAILDGNVKRVLARHFAIEGFPGTTAVTVRLWNLAESLLPEKGIETYTQALMDLGATLCQRSNPRCEQCPVQDTCQARASDRVDQLPGKRPRKPVPRKSTVMPILLYQGKVMLVKRPEQGIWGGLSCFPEFSNTAEALREIPLRYGCELGSQRPLPALQHAFTHFSLTIQALVCEVREMHTRASEPDVIWLPIAKARVASIPAPVRTLLSLLPE
jgi:A/G-specific adenine glycosylase